MRNALYRWYAIARRLFFRIWYIGVRVTCPICGNSFRKMLKGGEGSVPGIEIIPGGLRENVYCPACRSTDKERLLFRIFEKMNLFSTEGKKLRVLHFAPEINVTKLLAANPRLQYITCDITPGRAMEVVDITHIQFSDASFDVILCSHVLEHIMNDALAMSELHRVLVSGGFALLQVPLSTLEATFENSEVVTFADRERVFGQGDHVRIYGKDYKDRLTRAGFNVDLQSALDLFGSGVVERSGINPKEGVVIAWKK